jgi:pilus assembly protein CpaF
VTIEDAAELRIPLPHVVRLESRPPSLEGVGAVPIRALVRNALRMRPDRIVVGEVRGGEALDMLTAMTTGHEGSLSTLHASSPGDAIRRVQTMALMGDLDLPYRAVSEQVASALDLIVHQARLPDGSRAVESVTEVVRAAGGAGVRELYRIGSEPRGPGAGRLAERIGRLRREGRA